jgi:hypothetical protein
VRSMTNTCSIPTSIPFDGASSSRRGPHGVTAEAEAKTPKRLVECPAPSARHRLGLASGGGSRDSPTDTDLDRYGFRRKVKARTVTPECRPKSRRSNETVVQGGEIQCSPGGDARPTTRRRCDREPVLSPRKLTRD